MPWCDGPLSPVIPAVRRAPLIQTIAMIEPVEAAPPPAKAVVKPRPVARTPISQKVALLDDAAITDIARVAAKEAKAARR